MPNSMDRRGREFPTTRFHGDNSTKLRLSEHARTRMQQRGYRPDDSEIIVQHGTLTPGGYLMRNCDVDTLQRELKRQIRKLDHLRGSFVVLDGRTVISIYRPASAKAQRLLRSARAMGGA